MKKVIKIVLALAVAAGLSLPLSAQPDETLPSNEAWQAIQSSSEYSDNTLLPSEKASAELRADRPTDQVPIGGLDAPLPNPTLPVLIGFALAAAKLKRKRRYKRD